MEYKNDIRKHECKCEQGCDKECEVYAGICVPVELTPKASVGEIEVSCCGDPVVETENIGGSYKITITQQVLVKIPICYFVTTDVCNDDKKH